MAFTDGLVQFVTFSCYHRRRLLDHDQCKQAVIGVLAGELIRQEAKCTGFIVMPDHVHAIVHVSKSDSFPLFMKQWKQRSSVQIKRLVSANLISYSSHFAPDEPVWQRKYYAFELHTDAKLLEKLNYMHQNPVRAGLTARAADWPHSSAGWYEQGRPVGVPLAWSGTEPVGRRQSMPAA